MEKNEVELLDIRAELEYYKALAKHRKYIIKDYEKQMDEKGFSYTHHFNLIIE